MEKIIKKVCINKSSGQKFITIPKNCDIKEGEYVAVFKVKVELK
ncbi:MAG TPA: hypothetical protein VGB37_01130 [Candidatus Lokiarchaeia archaeon]